jgi:hypothetical protein
MRIGLILVKKKLIPGLSIDEIGGDLEAVEKGLHGFTALLASLQAKHLAGRSRRWHKWAQTFGFCGPPGNSVRRVEKMAGGNAGLPLSGAIRYPKLHAIELGWQIGDAPRFCTGGAFRSSGV